jgi:hypothetical protein
LLLLVRPEGEADQLVRLEYDLCIPPVIRRGMLPAEWAANEPQWMYDEIGIDGNAFTHDILLRDGSEIQVRFSGFRFARVRPLLRAG